MDEQAKKRRRGERKDGLIQVAVEAGRDADGKRIRKYFYGKTRKEAQAKADEFKQQLDGGLVVDGGEMLFSTWARRWLDVYKASVRYQTRKWYEGAVNSKIIPAFGKLRLQDIRPANIQNLYNSLNGMSDSAIKQVSITLSQIIDAAVKNGLIPYNPAKAATPPKGDKGSFEAVSREDTACLVKNWAAHRAGIWAMLMAFAGLRRGDG